MLSFVSLVEAPLLHLVMAIYIYVHAHIQREVYTHT